MHVLILSSYVLIQSVRSQPNMIFICLCTEPKYLCLYTKFSCRYRHTMQGVWKILFEFGTYNCNVHHHTPSRGVTFHHAFAWSVWEPGTDRAAGGLQNCVRAHTHTKYVCTQEPHFSITYYKSSTAHIIHMNNMMHKIMRYDCNRQLNQVCSTHSKPCSNVGSVTHVKIITNNYLSCTQKIQLHEGWNFNSGNYLFTTDTK